MMGSAASYGQDYLDIPLATDGTKTNLYWWIAQDTVKAEGPNQGDRLSDNRVYRLERGGDYYMQSNEPFNFSFAIVANDDTSTGDGTGRPPVIFRGRFEADGGGTNVQNLFVFSGNNNHYYFENIIFSALDYDDSYETEWTTGLKFLGNNTRVEIKSCVFNAMQAGGVKFVGKDNIVYLSDNTFRNGVQINQPFAGQQGDFSQQAIDTLVVTNNTYINNSSYWIIQGYGSGGLADYVLFEHNTIMGSVVNTLYIREMINAHLRSNIFYAEAVYGDSDASSGWYTEAGRLSVFEFTDVKGSKLADAGLTEADRVINVSHNTFYQPKAVTDFHAAYAGITGGVFMNDETKTLFDDNIAYPHLDMSNNVEVDPEFANGDVDEYVSDEVTASCKSFFDTDTGQGWGVAPDRRNIDENLSNSGEIRLMDWPLVEGDLEITSSSLLTGGHDGLPVGNLNWDASKRGQYNLPNGVGGMLGLSMFGGSLSNDNHDFTSKGYELSSYPNPAVETATIAFKLPKKSNVIISVYNTMGQQIAILANGSFAKGSHNVVWDASDVASGLYIYKLETEEVSQAHQIIITK